MMRIFLAPDNGPVNIIIITLGGNSINFFSNARLFRWLYVLSNIWQNFGWDSIIYIAAISGINPELYEAAVADGAGRWKKIWHITLPCLSPTIVVLLILRVGWLLSVGFEKILLMYNESTYETADVISTYVYRAGLLQADFSYGTAIGLFNSVISLVLLVSANFISKKVSETSLF
jgi:putative aldouronate transport system permease protein